MSSLLQPFFFSVILDSRIDVSLFSNIGSHILLQHILSKRALSSSSETIRNKYKF